MCGGKWKEDRTFPMDKSTYVVQCYTHAPSKHSIGQERVNSITCHYLSTFAYQRKFSTTACGEVKWIGGCFSSFYRKLKRFTEVMQDFVLWWNRTSEDSHDSSINDKYSRVSIFEVASGTSMLRFCVNHEIDESKIELYKTHLDLPLLTVCSCSKPSETILHVFLTPMFPSYVQRKKEGKKRTPDLRRLHV